jgi:hypothetical protein
MGGEFYINEKEISEDCKVRFDQTSGNCIEIEYEIDRISIDEDTFEKIVKFVRKCQDEIQEGGKVEDLK